MVDYLPIIFFYYDEIGVFDISVGRPLSLSIPNDDLESLQLLYDNFQSIYQKMMNGEIDDIYENELSLSSDITLRCIHAPTKNESGEIVGMVGTGIDISPLVATQEKLKIKIEDLDFFNRATYHELREPIRNIVSFSQLIKKAQVKNTPKKAEAFLESVERNGKRMNRLVQDISQYFKEEKSYFLRFNPFLLYSKEVKKVAEIYGKTLTLNDKIASLEIYSDAKLLQDIFHQLIDNSCKHNEEQHLNLNLGISFSNKKIIFQYSDQLHQIPNEYAEYIFLPFKQLRSNEKTIGSGLGLFFIKRKLQAAKGDISYQDGVFEFWLPA